MPHKMTKFMRKYRRRSEVKEKLKEYQQRPDVKTRETVREQNRNRSGVCDVCNEFKKTLKRSTPPTICVACYSKEYRQIKKVINHRHLDYQIKATLTKDFWNVVVITPLGSRWEYQIQGTEDQILDDVIERIDVSMEP